MARFQCVEQVSEEDCGAACIATVARQHGKPIPLPRIRELVGTGIQGTTLLGLSRGGEAIGFRCRPVRAESRDEIFADMASLPMPAIVHWQGNHWVVLHGLRRNRVVIADPAVGLRRLSRQEFLKGWPNGVLLLMEPDHARLRAQPEDRRARSTLARLFGYVTPYSGLLLNVLAVNAVIGVVGLAMPLLMQILTDDVLVRRDSQLLASLGLGMMLLFAFRAILDYFQGVMIGYFAERLELNMILQYGRKLLSMPMAYFDTHRSGEILSRISDLSRVNTMFGFLVLGVPSQFFVALVSLLVMVKYSAPLAQVSVLAFLLILVFELTFLPALRDKSRRMIVRSAENQGFLVEMFRGAQVLKTTEATPQAWQEYQANFGSLANLSWKNTQLTVLNESLSEMLNAMLHLGLLIYGSSYVLRGELSIGQLLAFNGMSANVLTFLSSVSRFGANFVTGDFIFGRLAEVLDGKSEEPDDSRKSWIQLPADQPIRCQALHFSHPGRVELIRGLQLEIPGGRTTALIGESGCGKSTLVKLIAGLYPTQRGVISFGPYGLRDIALDCLRRQVCLVAQDSQFFNRSVLDNFRFSHPEVNYEQVVKACELSLAHEFISELPDGYQTILGEFGANLSGGQKQRLAIARALVADPPVLILDESTASMDPVLESRLLDRLLEHRRGRTTVMISHRTAVILRCDWVIYLEKGMVRFQGPPAEIAQNSSAACFLLRP
ncbi:MAG: peptidase domain-containing ABC transporter [Synechococcaceae cyanobacterium]|nr:peptidase domain-containing ABC transporter [Synechococcaceae cyanobacterium]